MSDKEPPNPFEEIQRQLNELFKDSNVKVSTHTFNESDILDDADIHDGDEASMDGAFSATDPLEKIRHFHLKPKEVRDYLNRFVIRQDDAKKYFRWLFAITTTMFARVYLEKKPSRRSIVSKISYYSDRLEWVKPT